MEDTRTCKGCGEQFEPVLNEKKCFPCRYPPSVMLWGFEKPPLTKLEREAARKRMTCYHLQRKYGITLEQKEEMIRNQDGKCAICERALGKGAAVDHCHSTRKIRAILCPQCNHMLGHAKDSPIILNRAIEYVEHYRRVHALASKSDDDSDA